MVCLYRSRFEALLASTKPVAWSNLAVRIDRQCWLPKTMAPFEQSSLMGSIRIAIGSVAMGSWPVVLGCELKSVLVVGVGGVDS